jgi:hypothetical protein
VADDLLMAFAAKEPLFTYTILRPANVVGETVPNPSFRALLNAIIKRWFLYRLSFCYCNICACG